MKLIDRFIYPIIIAILIAFFTAISKVMGLDYADMFSKLTKEQIIFFIIVALVTGFLAWHITYHFCRKKYIDTDKDISAYKNKILEERHLKDSYKTELERRGKEDPELERIRAVHRYKEKDKE
ncbi:MAG: hypothetical protein LBJ91_03545 [Clostridiales Family XIII bacterium]|jgi:uncharacterized membrane protein (UPF0182 family)|nr:hypothetical protein [Clostridiales Family XIII bacterium]